MKYLGRYNYDKMLAWERDFAERLVICPVYDSSGFTCIGYDLYYIWYYPPRRNEGRKELSVENKVSRAEYLAKFIAKNWHWCPADLDVSVQNCEGWNGKIVKNV